MPQHFEITKLHYLQEKQKKVNKVTIEHTKQPSGMELQNIENCILWMVTMPNIQFLAVQS